MDQEKNLGVTEARFGLTLLTCLLVAIGYVALLRLGAAQDSIVEDGPDDVSPPIIAGPVEPQPRMLPLEPDNGRVPHTSERHDSKRR